jgi:hypothetical protein
LAEIKSPSHSAVGEILRNSGRWCRGEAREEMGTEGKWGFLKTDKFLLLANTYLFPHPHSVCRNEAVCDCLCPHGRKQVMEICNQHRRSEKLQLLPRDTIWGARAGLAGRSGKTWIGTGSGGGLFPRPF